MEFVVCDVRWGVCVEWGDVVGIGCYAEDWGGVRGGDFAAGTPAAIGAPAFSYSCFSLERDPIGNPDGEGGGPKALCWGRDRVSERSADPDAVGEPEIATEVNGGGEEQAAITDADAAEKVGCVGGGVDSDASREEEGEAALCGDQFFGEPEVSERDRDYGGAVGGLSDHEFGVCW